MLTTGHRESSLSLVYPTSQFQQFGETLVRNLYELHRLFDCQRLQMAGLHGIANVETKKSSMGRPFWTKTLVSLNEVIWVHL